MSKLVFEKSFGGRDNYFPCKFKKDLVGDCVIRTVAIITEQDYMLVMRELFELGLEIGDLPNSDKVYGVYLERKGFVKMKPQKNGRKGILLRDFNFKNDKSYAILLSGHLTALKNGINYDTWDGEDCCTYSYWVK